MNQEIIAFEIEQGSAFWVCIDSLQSMFSGWNSIDVKEEKEKYSKHWRMKMQSTHFMICILNVYNLPTGIFETVVG